MPSSLPGEVGPMPLPVIRTARLLLRPWRLEDIDALHALWTLPEVRRYLWDDVVITRAVAAQIVHSHLVTSDQNAIGYWAVHSALELSMAEAPMAGFCGFRFIDDGPEIELLYGMRREHWGQGLATEACGAVIDYLWRSTTFQSVYGRTDPPNERSVRVIQRLGMIHQSTTRSMISYILRRPQ